MAVSVGTQAVAGPGLDGNGPCLRCWQGQFSGQGVAGLGTKPAMGSCGNLRWGPHALVLQPYLLRRLDPKNQPLQSHKGFGALGMWDHVLLCGSMWSF